MIKKLHDSNAREPDSEESRSRVSSAERDSTSPLITLLTDFGTTDYFVGAVKGAILSINPRATIVDITHEIPPQDIDSAAFTLLAAYSAFPVRTIHLAVIDPGVGSDRRPIVIKASGHIFVGPDNGIFSYVCEGAVPQIFQLTNPNFFRTNVSSTFHGRDIFAPVAAALSNGIEADDLGTEVEGFVRLPPLRPKGWSDGQLEGRIIHIDRFGNCVTNVTRDELSVDDESVGLNLVVNGQVIDSFRKFYAQESEAGELFGVWGSAGFLEISTQNGSAANLLKAKRGDIVVLKSGTVGRQIQNRER